MMERPKCDVKGCDNISFFHGFGRDVCRVCYDRLMRCGGFYRRQDEEKYAKMQETGQLELFGRR